MAALGGQTIGKYRIVAEIGRGGMAVVYKAYDAALNRYVALKMLAPHLAWDEAFVQRFYSEARAVARLKHPNIVSIYEVGQHKGRPFLAMEYLDGRPLSQAIRADGAWPAERAAALLTQVASALDYAHDQGIVHRDIKSSNIVVGAYDHATLTDFGLAKAATGLQLTQSGSVVGTPAYVSPEQARGEPVTPATDIYSLGVVMYELLSGRTPFAAETPHALVYAHIHTPPPPVNRVNPAVPGPVANAVQKALAKDPARRYRTAGEFAVAFAVAVGKSGPPAPGNRLWLVALLAAVGVAALVLGVLLLRSRAEPAAAPGDQLALIPTQAPPTSVPVAVASASPSPPPTSAPIVAAPTPMPTAPVSTAPLAAQVYSSVANVRAAPGAVQALMATLPKDTAVQVLGRSRDNAWLYVATAGGQRGWIARAALLWSGQVEALPMAEIETPTPTLTATATPSVTTAATASPSPVTSPTAGAATPSVTATVGATATATPSPAPTATATLPPRNVLSLSAPANGAAIDGMVPFAWLASLPLGAGETFDVQVCKGAGCAPQFGVVNVRELSYRWCPAEMQQGAGVYRWRVAVIDSASKEPKGPLSETRQFTWTGGCGEQHTSSGRSGSAGSEPGS